MIFNNNSTLLPDSEYQEINDCLKCEDCGLSYDEFGLDTVMPNSQWWDIHDGNMGGILCANCILKRAAKLTSASCAHLILEIGIHPNHNERM